MEGPSGEHPCLPSTRGAELAAKLARKAARQCPCRVKPATHLVARIALAIVAAGGAFGVALRWNFNANFCFYTPRSVGGNIVLPCCRYRQPSATRRIIAASRSSRGRQRISTAAAVAQNQPATHEDYDAAVLRYCQGGNSTAGGQLLTWMKDADFAPQRKTYAVLVDACSREGRCVQALRFLKDMVRARHTPDAVLMQNALDSCALQGALNLAHEVFEAMRELMVVPHAKTFTSLISACAKRGHARDAESWLRRYHHMADTNVGPNVVTYNAVIGAHARRGDVENATAYFKELVAHEIAPDVITYTSLISACANGRQAGRAEKWFAQMKSESVKPSRVTYLAMIQAHARANNSAQAEWWLSEMKRDEVDPDIAIYTAVASACACAGKMDRATRWLDMLEQHGLRADRGFYSAVLKGVAARRDVDGSVDWIREMERKGFPPGVKEYTQAIAACAHSTPKQPQVAETLWHELSSAGLQPDTLALGALERAVGQDQFKELVAGDPLPKVSSHRRRGGRAGRKRWNKGKQPAPT